MPPLAAHRGRALALLAGCLVTAALAGAAPASAATLQILNSNSGSTGFSDPAPANAAAGANGASTLGQQRLRVLQRAAEIWGAVLASPVPIRVSVQMINQSCEPGSTTLASAGPDSLYGNFPGAPRANTLYHVAQANALAGQDLSPSRPHILANFNLAIDGGCSANAVGWWYGTDPSVPVPPDRIALLPVALHELAHGLGFSVQANLETGSWLGQNPSVWANYLYDLEIGRHWRAMTNGERVQSARNDPDLIWSGIQVNRRLDDVLDRSPQLRIPAARGGFADITNLALPVAGFGPGHPDGELSGVVVAVNDGVAAAGSPPGTVFDGCESPFRNGSRLPGRIALIDRGLCPFTEKVRNAQQHGAIAVIIANNVDGPAPTMAGSAPDITIPVVGVDRETGLALRRQLLRPSLSVVFARSAELAGTRNGCMRMFAPGTLRPGSSVSHFHSEAMPDLLMEPSVTPGLFDDVDLALDLFRDIGWPVLVAPLPAGNNGCPVQPLP